MERVELVGGAATPTLQKGPRHRACPSLRLIFSTMRAPGRSPDLLDIILAPRGPCQRPIRLALTTRDQMDRLAETLLHSLDEARRVTQGGEARGANIVVHEEFPLSSHGIAAIKADRSSAGTSGQVQQYDLSLCALATGQAPTLTYADQPYLQKMDRFLSSVRPPFHWVDTFRYLLGDPIARSTQICAASTRSSPARTRAIFLFEHPGGVRALFDGNRHLDNAADNLAPHDGRGVCERNDRHDYPARRRVRPPASVRAINRPLPLLPPE